jgi:hypothetical protein
MPVKNPFFLFADTLLFDEKSAKVLHKPYSALVWETQNRPPIIKHIVPDFFEDRFVEKDCGLCTRKLSSVCRRSQRIGDIFVLGGSEL